MTDEIPDADSVKTTIKSVRNVLIRQPSIYVA